MGNIFLAPQPRTITMQTGEHALRPDRFITLQGAEPFRLLFMAEKLQKDIEKFSGIHLNISASPSGEAELKAIVLHLKSDSEIKDQGYELAIKPEQITIEASSAVGLFYGVCTLTQIVEQSKVTLPCLEISDWPDFANRGFMLDISRTKVPTLATVLDLVDRLASWKINQFQLYTEHTFAYLNHKEVWSEASPFTGQDILELDQYCRDRFIELVPNQNTFGHMHRWLEHPRYYDLAETHESFKTQWGTMHGPFSLDPSNPASLELIKSLLDELLPHFSSQQINIGCDETFDLGQGKNKALCEEIGKGQVYLDFLLKISQEVINRGYKVQFWGDIVLEHPELVPRLPKEITALLWGYEADHPFEADATRFEAAGIPFYVCPGTSTWNSLAGRTQNALANLLSAAEAGLRHGAKGYLNTDWGDNGHWQPLPVSYLGILAGAAYSWGLEANRNLDIVAVLNRYVFEDEANLMGQVAYQMGNLYSAPELAYHNSSELFHLLQYTPAELEKNQQAETSSQGVRHVSEATLTKVLHDVDAIMEPIGGTHMHRPDAELIKQEYEMLAKLIQLACWRGLAALHSTEPPAEYYKVLGEVIPEYRKVWLSRNRPGGLPESISKLLALQEPVAV